LKQSVKLIKTDDTIAPRAAPVCITMPIWKSAIKEDTRFRRYTIVSFKYDASPITVIQDSTSNDTPTVDFCNGGVGNNKAVHIT